MTQGASDRSAVVLPPRINVLGVGVHPINMDQALDAIDRWIALGEKHYVCLTPIHSILACRDDPDLKRVFNQSGLTAPDGMPLVWISRASGHPQANRVYGPDVMQYVSRRSLLAIGTFCWAGIGAWENACRWTWSRTPPASTSWAGFPLFSKR
jgi:UDP-N-acetyl-D-mannosaminuronic acid transferase (WecB/TagA/CpsF family)